MCSNCSQNIDIIAAQGGVRARREERPKLVSLRAESSISTREKVCPVTAEIFCVIWTPAWKVMARALLLLKADANAVYIIY
jgi:hypothetical protein